MKFLISYFYQIRFFNKNQIPISTALWDPKWFHDFKNQSHVFIDKRGVVNGVRSPILNPVTEECCGCDTKIDNCDFKINYKKYLDTIDFNEFIKDITKGINAMCRTLKIEDPEVILIVHETPDNPCSERGPLIQWFAEHDITLEEFTK